MVDVVTSPRPVDEAAALLARWMREVHAARGACRLGVPGGSALAAVKAAREALDADVWRATRLTFVDERVVPVNSADSNRGAAERGGALTPAPGLVLPLVEDGEDGPAACARVSTAFTRDFGGALDVALLGMWPTSSCARCPVVGRAGNGRSVPHSACTSVPRSWRS